MRNDNAELRRALKASLRLQAHYAKLLNLYDRGERIIFEDMDEWLARLREVEERVRLAAGKGGPQKVVAIAESLEEESCVPDVDPAGMAEHEVQP
jgi:hypothetical protein